MAPLTVSCSHVKSTIHYIWHKREDTIFSIGSLNRQYRNLTKNMSPDSEWLLDDDITIRVITKTTN